MKNVLVAIIGLLVAAVGFLFYKVYSLSSGNTPAAAAPKPASLPAGDHISIAYIDMDSIQNEYELAKTVQEEIKKKQSVFFSEIERLEKNYKNKLDGYQKKGPTMTEEQANEARRDLEATQAAIMEHRQNSEEEFKQFVTTKNLFLKKKIEDYLKEFNANKTYSFILAYEPGLFYYKDPSFDITEAVLKGLNEQAKKEKSTK